MAKLNQTSITGSLIVSGSSILMPNLTGSVDSGSGGQLWLDDAAGLKMKFTKNFSLTAGTFSAASSIITARSSGGSGGTTSAGWIAAGNAAPSSTAKSCTEEYNGSTWSAGGNVITARFGAGGAGTQNAGLLFAVV